MSNAVFLRPDENGNWGKVGSDPTGNMSSLLTFQSGAVAIGNGTAVDVSGYSTLFTQVTISNTATVSFEGSLDGTNYSLIATNSQNGTGTSQTTTNAAGTSIWRFNVAGLKFVRFRISAYTSGTIDVTGYASTALFSPLYLTSTFGNNDTNSVSSALQGVGAYNLIFDGTNWSRQRSATAAGDGNSSGGLPTTSLMGFNGSTWDRVRTANDGATVGVLAAGSMVYDTTGSVFNKQLSALSAGDGNSGNKIATQALMAFNGATFDRQRVGKVYKHIEYLNLADNTGTTVWTPATGKKFRLMGVSVSSSAAGRLALRDNSSGTDYIARFLYNAADTKTFDFGNGYVSLAANNVLEIRNNSGTAVSIWVTAWGTEE